VSKTKVGPLKLRRKYEADDSYRIVRFLRPKIVKARIILQWRGFPKDYELSFAMKMDELGRQGIQFSEVLREVLPQIIGDDTSEILRRWVGRSARKSPIAFVKAVNRMFGGSGRSILTSIESLANGEKMGKKVVEEPLFDYLTEKVRLWEEQYQRSHNEGPNQNRSHSRA